MTRIVAVVDLGYDDYAVEAGLVAAAGGRLRLHPEAADAPSLRAALADAWGLMLRESRLDDAAMAAAPGLRAVVRYGVGIDNIDLEAAARRGIAVANVPDYGTDEVATHALALLLSVARRTVQRDRAVRAGAWGVARAEPMHRLAGGTLGLIGCGRIGAAFLAKCAGLGFARVLVSDPGLRALPPGAEAATPAEIARASDAVALFAPLSPATRHLVDRAFLAAMKPTAVLVNASRGGLIDEDALADALRSGRLLGAGLDVFEREPVAADHPLLSLPNAVVTDHTAWYSEQSLVDLQRKAGEEMARMLRGEPPANPVNRPREGAARQPEWSR